MNLPTFIVLAALIAVIFLTIRRLRRNKAAGKTACGCSCGCGSCADCGGPADVRTSKSHPEENVKKTEEKPR